MVERSQAAVEAGELKMQMRRMTTQ